MTDDCGVPPLLPILYLLWTSFYFPKTYFGSTGQQLREKLRVHHAELDSRYCCVVFGDCGVPRYSARLSHQSEVRQHA